MHPITSATPKIITPIRPGPAPNFESSTADPLAIGNYLVCVEYGLSAAWCCQPCHGRPRWCEKGHCRLDFRICSYRQAVAQVSGAHRTIAMLEFRYCRMNGPSTKVAFPVINQLLAVASFQ